MWVSFVRTNSESNGFVKIHEAMIKKMKLADWLPRRKGKRVLYRYSMWTFWLMNVVHRSRQTDFFSCKVTPDSFTQRLLASLISSTWWWLFKDGWRKTEASRYGIWLRPPASCESDSICLNVWEQAKRKEPSFSSAIWTFSYLSLVEEIPRCPHRSTGQLWHGELLQSCWRVGLSQNASSTFQPMKELFIFGRQNNLFTPECVLSLEIFPSIFFMCHWSHYDDMKGCFSCFGGSWGDFDVLWEPNIRTIFSYIWLKPTSNSFS